MAAERFQVATCVQCEKPVWADDMEAQFLFWRATREETGSEPIAVYAHGGKCLDAYNEVDPEDKRKEREMAKKRAKASQEAGPARPKKSKKTEHQEKMLENLSTQTQEVREAPLPLIALNAMPSPMPPGVVIPVPEPLMLLGAPSPSLLPDLSYLQPFDGKPKDLVNHSTLGGLAGNEEFEQAVLRHAQLNLQKKAIESAMVEYKTTILAHMGIADVEACAVGRFKVQIVRKSQPSLKKDLLLENGVTPDQIEKSTVWSPVEYPLVDDMNKPKKSRGGQQESEAAE